MLEILLYGVGVMYSPGPVNIIGFNEGLKGRFQKSMPFFLGVGTAMFIWCITLGYLGQYIVPKSVLPFLAIIGCAYILYLSLKILRSARKLDLVKSDDEEREATKTTVLSFSNGLLIQLLNPKAMLALIPITTIMFPASNVFGEEIIWYAFLIGFLAMWAPGGYSYIGSLIYRRKPSVGFIVFFNYLMVIFLLGSAVIISYEYVVVELFL